MSRIKIRYLVEKPQAGGHSLWYWQPTATLRKLGWHPRRLAEATNRPEDAAVEAERLNRDLDRWRAGLGERTIEPGTLPHLIKVYRGTDYWTGLAPKTHRGYEQGIALLEAWSCKHDHPPIAGLEPRHVREMLNEIAAPSMRHLAYSTIRLLLNFAVREGHVARNVASNLRVKRLPARQVYWSEDQITAFVVTSEKAGRASLGLAVRLATNLAQREGDIIRLAWSQFDGDAFTIRQRKTGRNLTIPATAQLRDALAQAPKSSPTIVISEATGRPYTEDYLRNIVAKIRKAAGLPSDLRFADLRRTAIVRLAEAGCTVPQISAISGHSVDRTAAIIETYMPRTLPMARTAIAQLEKAREERTNRERKLEGNSE